MHTSWWNWHSSTQSVTAVLPPSALCCRWCTSHQAAGRPQRGQALVAGRARGQDHVAGAVERAEGKVRDFLELRSAGAQPDVRAQLGVIAADAGEIEHAGEQPGGDAGRAGRTDVDDVVTSLGQRVDD